MDAEAGEATIRVDVEADVGGGRCTVEPETMHGVGLQARTHEQLEPLAVTVATAQRRPARRVADEVRGVELGPAYDTARRQPDRHVVVAVATPAGVLPSLPHVACTVGAQDVRSRAVEGV